MLLGDFMLRCFGCHIIVWRDDVIIYDGSSLDFPRDLGCLSITSFTTGFTSSSTFELEIVLEVFVSDPT